MIPRPLGDIDWSDVERLVELNREEDDRIEFKSSFKGEDDYVALNDVQRQRALDSLAREVIAFLNTRGGDVIVGIKEANGPRPVAAEITPLKNASDAADRIGRGLAAVIEPAQTNITVRGLLNPADNSEGVVIIRVQSSVRAPHRSKRTLECFARRGSESVPMAMDEVQDLTLNRSRIRLEQMELLDRQFADFQEGKAEHRHLGNWIFHIRTVAFPLLDQSIEIGDPLLHELRNRNPVIYNVSGKGDQHTVPFRSLYSRWRPILRGRKQESFETYDRIGISHPTPHYASKIIKESGVCTFDYAQLADLNGTPGIYSQWVLGYLAEVCEALKGLWNVLPQLLPSIVRVGVRSRGDISVAYPTPSWSDEIVSFPESVTFLPDFWVGSIDELDEFFRQVQIDFFALLNVDLVEPYLLTPPRQ